MSVFSSFTRSQVNFILNSLRNIMSAQEVAQLALETVSAQLAAVQANQTEAFIELQNHTTQVASLQASVDTLTAQLVMSGASSITPALQAAIDAVVAAVPAVVSSSAALAAIVPNPVV
jgi:phage-related protein